MPMNFQFTTDSRHRDPAPATPEQESFLSAYAAFIQGQVVESLERHGQHSEPEDAERWDADFDGGLK